MLGEISSLLCAFCWAAGVILFRKSESVTPQGINLFKNVLGTALLTLTLLALGDGIAWDRSPSDWVRLGTSGIIGIGIADTLFFHALRRIGPGLIAIVECVYAPAVIALSALLLGERMHVGFILGAALVVGGVLLATADISARARHVDRTTLRKGALLGVVSVATMALGIVIAKPAIERSPLVEVTLVRMVFGLMGQFVWIALVRRERAALRVLRPQHAWRTLVPGAVIGAYASMLFWIAGFKWTGASVAAVLNQLSTLFILILARVFLGEPLTPRRVLGAGSAVAGTLLVVLAPLS